MPKYRVTGPDGKTYDVEAPNGAKPDEVLEFVRQSVEARSKSQAQPPRKGGGYLESIGDAFTGAVKKLGDDWQANVERDRRDSRRPLGQQLADAPRKLIGEGLGDAMTGAGNVLNLIGAPLHAAAHPVGEGLSNVLYDAGVKPSAHEGVPRLLGGQGSGYRELSREEAADQMTADLLTGAGMVLPVKRPVPAAAPKPPRLTGPKAKAVRKLDDLVKGSDRTPDQAFTANGLTTAENLGPGAEGILMAASRRPGATGNALTAALEQRNATLPRRVEDAMERSTGIMRDFIAGDIDSIVSNAQKKAAPLYEEYAQLGPVTSPRLEGLLQTPHIRRALKPALENALNEGAPLSDVVQMQRMVDGLPTGPAAANPLPYLPQAAEYLQTRNVAAALRRSRGPSLTEYLANSGGLRDAGGDIAALDGHLLHRDVPFRRKLIRPEGRGLDDAAQAAWESGYFGDLPEAPAVPDFIEAIRADIAGQRRFAKPATEAQELSDRISDFEQLLARHEIDSTGKTPKQLADEVARREAEARALQEFYDNGPASVEPAYETVMQDVPTPRILNDVKKVLDKDYIQRRVAAEKKGADPQDWSKDKAYAEFKEEVGALFEGLGFDYKGMLAAGGEAPRVQEAYRAGKNLILNNDVDGLRRATVEMTDLEKRTALGGFVKDVLDEITAKQGMAPGKLRLYQSEDFSARIAHMAGDPQAGVRFQNAMHTILTERRGLRMMPRTNSVTGEIAQGNAELEGAGLGGVKINSLSPKSMVQDFAESKLQGLIDALHTPGATAARDELGRMLIDPVYARQAYNEYLASGGNKIINFDDFMKMIELGWAPVRAGGVAEAVSQVPSVTVPPLVPRAATAGPPRKEDRKK